MAAAAAATGGGGHSGAVAAVSNPDSHCLHFFALGSTSCVSVLAARAERVPPVPPAAAVDGSRAGLNGPAGRSPGALAGAAAVGAAATADRHAPRAPDADAARHAAALWRRPPSLLVSPLWQRG